MMSQNDEILKHLKERGPITPLQALNLYRVMRLAARIDDLRRRGYTIATKLKRVPDKRTGRVKSYAVYSLED